VRLPKLPVPTMADVAPVAARAGCLHEPKPNKSARYLTTVLQYLADLLAVA
jgi:hypothetical protein